MDCFILNKINPKLEFRLNSDDSYLLIRSVSLLLPEKPDENWPELISKVTLLATLEYTVFVDSQGQFIDERNKQLIISLFQNSQKLERIINLNILIKNETFFLGINSDQKSYQKLKIELNDIDEIDGRYAFEFNIEKYNLVD